jgi:multimeric flavodoxin WrbA
MKLVAILGSPHGMKGNTGQLLTGLLEGAKEAGAEVTAFSLSEKEVAPCRACDACHKTGKCSIQDDFPEILLAMLNADAIVLASPNYILSVSAQMKALLDRCCGALHLQIMEGKHAAAVVTSGGSGSEEVEAYMLRFLRTLGCWTVGSLGAEGRQLFDEDSRTKLQVSAASLGAKLVAAAESQQTFPEQRAERAAFHERMKQLVTFRREEWPYEYEYWKAAGRL